MMPVVRPGVCGYYWWRWWQYKGTTMTDLVSWAEHRKVSVVQGGTPEHHRLSEKCCSPPHIVPSPLSGAAVCRLQLLCWLSVSSACMDDAWRRGLPNHDLLQPTSNNTTNNYHHQPFSESSEYQAVGLGPVCCAGVVVYSFWSRSFLQNSTSQSDSQSWEKIREIRKLSRH